MVEDDEIQMRTLEAVFQRVGAQVVTARAPDEALRILRSVVPGLVVTDIDFSGAPTGLNLLAYLRQSGDHHDIPSFVVSGCLDANTRAQAIRFGALDYVPKPCTAIQLVRRICGRL